MNSAGIPADSGRSFQCAPVANRGDTFDGLAVEPVSET